MLIESVSPDFVLDTTLPGDNKDVSSAAGDDIGNLVKLRSDQSPHDSKFPDGKAHLLMEDTHSKGP